MKKRRASGRQPVSGRFYYDSKAGDLILRNFEAKENPRFAPGVNPKKQKTSAY